MRFSALGVFAKTGLLQVVPEPNNRTLKPTLWEEDCQRLKARLDDGRLVNETGSGAGALPDPVRGRARARSRTR
jgi:hypothetical protein